MIERDNQERPYCAAGAEARLPRMSSLNLRKAGSLLPAHRFSGVLPFSTCGVFKMTQTVLLFILLWASLSATRLFAGIVNGNHQTKKIESTRTLVSLDPFKMNKYGLQTRYRNCLDDTSFITFNSRYIKKSKPLG